MRYAAIGDPMRIASSRRAVPRDEASQRRLCAAPAPEFFSLADGAGLNGSAHKKRSSLRQRLRGLVAAGRLFLQAFQAEVSRSRGTLD